MKSNFRFTNHVGLIFLLVIDAEKFEFSVPKIHEHLLRMLKKHNQAVAAMVDFHAGKSSFELQRNTHLKRSIDILSKVSMLIFLGLLIFKLVQIVRNENLDFQSSGLWLSSYITMKYSGRVARLIWCDPTPYECWTVAILERCVKVKMHVILLTTRMRMKIDHAQLGLLCNLKNSR